MQEGFPPLNVASDKIAKKKLKHTYQMSSIGEKPFAKPWGYGKIAGLSQRTSANHNDQRLKVRRYNAVDAMRGIGIVLVVLGHTLGISQGLEYWIFSFHMPLFFFLSGYVLKPARLSAPFGQSVRHYARSLLLPYLAYSFLTYIPWVLFTRHYGADAALHVPAWKPLLGTFYGIGIDGWLQHNAMLWFFPCLFLVHLLYRGLAAIAQPGIQTSAGILVLAAIGLAMHALSAFRWPWSLEIALVALPFYAVGNWLAVHGAPQFSRGKRIVLFLPILLGIQLLSIYLNGRVDMNFLSFGNPALFYIGAFAGIGALSIAVAFLDYPRFWNMLAKAAIVIFPLHRLFFSIISAAGLLLFHDFPAFKTSALASLVYTLAAVSMGIALTPIIRRFFPVLMGGRA